jgi:hypothetical protein
MTLLVLAYLGGVLTIVSPCDRGQSAILVGLHRPSSGDGRQRGDRKGDGHAGQHRQTASDEGPIRPREHEWKNRKDARADDRENAAKV